MSEKIDTRVIQVTNLAPSCTMDQLQTLFCFLGRIKELQMFPPESVDMSAVTVRVAYIEFEEVSTTGVSLHLNGTVFVDRALVIVPVMDGKIPDESTALHLTPQAVAGMLPGQPTWPANVVSQMTGTGTNQAVTTFDPKLTSLGLPQYPPLSASLDPVVIEEIRRTVYVSNLDDKVSGEDLLTFFTQAGEVKFVRMAGDDAAYVEFSDQRSVAQALLLDQKVCQGQSLSIHHAKTQIIKPQAKESGSPSRSKRTRSRSKGRSRSRSRMHRSRSRSKGRRRRSRSKSRRRSRSRHRSPRRSRSPRRRRSRSRGRVAPPALSAARRSRSRDRRRSRTRSPVRKRRSRSGSRRKRSRTPPKSYSTKRSRSRSRKRSVSRSRKRSRSRDRKAKEKKKSPSLSPPRLERNGSIPPTDGSPARRDSSVNDEESSKKVLSKKRSASPGPSKSRRRSPSPRIKRSRSRSPRRPKRRRKTRSPSPKKRSRSRSGSRHRSKRDRGKRSRSRDRKHDNKKKSSRDKDKEDKKKDSSSSKVKPVKRDYDEEEKGYGSAGSDKEQPEASEESAASGGESPPPRLDTMEKEDHQTVDMDMSD